MTPKVQQLLTTHVLAWRAVPQDLIAVNPITHVNGDGLDLLQRLESFMKGVRASEAGLYRSLGMNPSSVDRFWDHSGGLSLLFWQLPLPWVRADRSQASLIIEDMEILSVSLRTLQSALKVWDPSSEILDENSLQAMKEVGFQTNFLRRYLNGRARLAEEVSPLLASEPGEGLHIFYDAGIRKLRRVDPPGSLKKPFL